MQMLYCCVFSVANGSNFAGSVVLNVGISSIRVSSMVSKVRSVDSTRIITARFLDVAFLTQIPHSSQDPCLVSLFPLYSVMRSVDVLMYNDAEKMNSAPKKVSSQNMEAPNFWRSCFASLKFLISFEHYGRYSCLFVANVISCG